MVARAVVMPGCQNLSWRVARRVAWGMALTLTCLVGAARGQGSLADYERSAALRGLTRDKVWRDRVDPQWFADGEAFWYRVSAGPRTYEYALVRADQGTRRPAFDHIRLAAALRERGHDGATSTTLALDGLQFDSPDGPLHFLYDGQAYTWAPDTGTLSDTDLEEVSLPALPIDGRLPNSASGGRSTFLVFVNRTAAPARLFWIDTSGQRQAYGEIAAGERREQHTYVGHVWLVVGPDDAPLAAFRAGDGAGRAIIESAAPSSPSPRRGEGGRRGAGGDRDGRQRPGVSPDGRFQAFIQDHNLRIRNLEDGEEFPLTSDGTAERGYDDRFYWSPDSQRLIALLTSPGEDRQVHLIESSPPDQLQPRLHSFLYRKPGDRIPQSWPRLFHVADEKAIPIDDSLFDNPWSITEMRWTPDSRRFLFLYNQRGHQVMRVIALDGDTGEGAAVINEECATFFDYSGKLFFRFLETTNEILWMSERSGWNHLFLVCAVTGAVKNPITEGEWVVRGVDRVDVEARQIWFRAGGIYPDQDPYYIHHCRVNFDGTGLVRLTEGDGTHEIAFSPDRRYYIDTWSRVDLPPVTELRRAEDGARVCVLEQADWSALLATGWRPPERFVAKGRDGETDIHGVLLFPTNYDPDRKYPVVENIYAGPHGSFTPKEFRPFHSMQAMAELGFILVQMDGMGTSHRSKAFHDVAWKNLGDSGFPDRIAWMRAAAEQHPAMDLTRVGVYGGSAGGQSSTRAVLAHGDFYHVAVSDCGCHDNRMDKIWWNELWMSWPIGPHYAEQSNVTQAHRLEGKLLLIVGEMDRNVDPASTMQVVNALVRADKDFDMLILPGTGHGAAESAYGSRRRMDFLTRHLLGVTPRWTE